MNKKIKRLLIILTVIMNVSCFDDGESSGPKGTLKITVKTSANIWGYPKLYSGSQYYAYSGDTAYTWQYSEVGGNDSSSLEYNISAQTIPYPETELGSLLNYVYVYSSLGTSANSTAVLYKGSSSENEAVITISDIKPGSYYIVAFYDYAYGGNQTNQLNRYDRYAIYSSTNAYSGTTDSTPFKDYATAITVTGDQETSITIEIGRDWVLGKPKTATITGVGRVFLQSSDAIPSP